VTLVSACILAETKVLFMFEYFVTLLSFVCWVILICHGVIYSFLFYKPDITKSFVFSFLLLEVRGTQWRSWLRHCATSWKVVGLILDCVTEFFIDIILLAAL
jgi:hypothetical protein